MDRSLRGPVSFLRRDVPAPQQTAAALYSALRNTVVVMRAMRLPVSSVMSVV